MPCSRRVLAAVLVAALGRVRWLLIDRFHPQALLSADARTVFATLSPAASGIASACQETLFWLALMAVVAYLVRYLRTLARRGRAGWPRGSRQGWCQAQSTQPANSSFITPSG
jgi:hypothetical protein